MKRNLLSILVILILVSVVLISCKKDDNNNQTTNKSLTCKIIQPVNNQKIELGATVNILVEAESQNSPVIGVNYFVDGTNIGTAVDTPYIINWNTTAESLGVHEIKALSYDSIGNNTSDKISVELEQSTGCPSTFVDPRDNHVYSAVQIGTQCWMAENLKYLPSVCHPVTMLNPCHWVYGYTGLDVGEAKATSFYNIYGVLYNWATATTDCPAGWHLPSDEEWKILEGEADSQYGYPDQEWDKLGVYRGSDVGGNLKEEGTSYWIWPNTGATNKSGFIARPGGSLTSASFYAEGGDGVFWTSTASSGNNAFIRQLRFDLQEVLRDDYSKGNGLSVRCVKDN